MPGPNRIRRKEPGPILRQPARRPLQEAGRTEFFVSRVKGDAITQICREPNPGPRLTQIAERMLRETPDDIVHVAATLRLRPEEAFKVFASYARAELREMQRQKDVRSRRLTDGTAVTQTLPHATAQYADKLLEEYKRRTGLR